MKAKDAYLAVRVDPENDRFEQRMWDMLRYDRCYPVNMPGIPDNWVVLKQPYLKDLKPGFTLGRWRSFGYVHLVEVHLSLLESDYTFAHQVVRAEADLIVVPG